MENKSLITCKYCNKEFSRPTRLIGPSRSKDRKYYFCSKKCNQLFRTTKQQLSCLQCDKLFLKKQSEIKKSPRHFCSKSCAARYNNTHKTKGTRKSKLERWLESKLPAIYTHLEFHFNHKDAINSELDIYIPTLRLAFELNGIFHYEPVYGSEKLNQIQNNDHRKFAACLEKQISLCIIDTSSLKYFKEQNCLKYLDIIKDIINTKLLAADNCVSN